MASKLDKILKLLESLGDEEIEKVSEALPKKDEEVEEVEETKEEVKEKKEETKKELPSYVTKDELEATIKAIFENVTTKSELDEVKKEVDTSRKKAKPFGAENKVDNTQEDKSQPSTEDLLRVINSKFR